VTHEDFEQSLEGTEEILLMTTGRISGRETSRPVWFVRDRGKLFLLPGNGLDSQWYKNILTTPTIRLSARGVSYETTAQPVASPEVVDWVVEAFEAKYGARQIEALYPQRNAAVEVAMT
jgi:hypothetical protein